MTSATFPAPALPKWRPELPKSRTSRRWVLAQLAAAALLIIALIGGYVWFEGRNEQPAVVVPSTPEPTPGDDKNQYRYGPNRSGVSPSDGPTGQPIELWSAQTQGPITAEPAVVDGVVYLWQRGRQSLRLRCGQWRRAMAVRGWHWPGIIASGRRRHCVFRESGGHALCGRRRDR